MTGNYQKGKRIVLNLYQDELLKDKIIVVGGTVPYLISKKESVREHSDIDIIVRQEHMPFVREYLRRKDLPVIDSLNLSYNKQRSDYGIDAVIEGVTVNFAPYELAGNRMIQRNFLTKQSSGIDALAAVAMKNIDVDKVFAETVISGITIHTYSLEMVRLMKKKSRKKKDAVDIKVIDDFGYDESCYSVLKKQLKDMEFTIKPKNKILGLFFH